MNFTTPASLIPNLLTETTISNLVDLCVGRVVKQDELVRRGFDLVTLIRATRQLLNCGLRLQYVDTRTGYVVAPASMSI